MRKNKGLLVLVLLAVLVAVPFQVSASPGRLSGLGLSNATSWMLSVDEGYFFLNPAVLMKLRPQIWADLFVPDVGLLLGLGSNFNLYLVSGLNVANPYALVVPVTGITDMSHELARLGAGFAIGKMNIGISAFAAGTSFSNATEKDSDLMVGVNAGIIVPFSQSFSLDAAGGITYWSVQRSVAPFAASPLDIMADARLNVALAQNNTLHGYVQFNLNNRDYSNAGVNTAIGNTILYGGLADEMAITDAVLVFAGAGVNANFVTLAAGSTNTYTIAANAGGEIKIGQPLVVRLGITKTFETITFNSAAGSTDTVDGTFGLFGGLGLNLGDLTIDAELNPALFTNGPNFISGASPNPWTFDLSVTYYFGKAK